MIDEFSLLLSLSLSRSVIALVTITTQRTRPEPPQKLPVPSACSHSPDQAQCVASTRLCHAPGDRPESQSLLASGLHFCAAALSPPLPLSPGRAARRMRRRRKKAAKVVPLVSPGQTTQCCCFCCCCHSCCRLTICYSQNWHFRLCHVPIANAQAV